MTCGDGSATNTAAGEWIKMAKKLCETLQKGHVRYGNIRVPLNGDTTRLALAEGLSPQERSLARNMAYKAEFFPGTCLLYTSPSPRDGLLSRMPSSA